MTYFMMEEVGRTLRLARVMIVVMVFACEFGVIDAIEGGRYIATAAMVANVIFWISKFAQVTESLRQVRLEIDRIH